MATSDEWELSKENFQPIKQGRIAEQLEAKSSDANAVEQMRRQYWREIVAYKGDDPLEVWLRFIKWTQQTFTSGGLQAELVQLLERCTNELKGMDKYKNDADNLSDPKDVFQFMQANDIGQDTMLFYAAYASYCELKGSFARADKLYQEGIQKQAQPLERLKQKHVDFQHRMARRIQRKAQQEAEQGGPSHEDGGGVPERASLGVIKQRRAPRAAAVGGGGVQARPPTDENNPSAAFHVFEEGENDNHDYSNNNQQHAQHTTWNELGTRVDRSKENTVQPSTWAGARLTQHGHVSTRGGGGVGGSMGGQDGVGVLEVYHDDECRQAVAAGAGGASGDASGDGNTSGGVMPLRRVLDGDAARRPSLHAAARASATVATDTIIPAWDEALLIHPTSPDESCCFEEARLAVWMASHPVTPPMLLGEGGVALSPVAEGSHEYSQESEAQQVHSSDRAPITQRLPLPSSNAPSHFATVPVPLDTMGPSFPPGCAEPTLTINTREALSAMNHMFSTALPHEHAHVPSAAMASMAVASSEPTVTISTADALKAIGMAFDARAATETEAHGSVEDGIEDGMFALQIGGDDGDGGEGLAVYEDTQLLGSGEEAGLAVYEDTQLLNVVQETGGRGLWGLSERPTT